MGRSMTYRSLSIFSFTHGVTRFADQFDDGAFFRTRYPSQNESICGDDPSEVLTARLSGLGCSRADSGNSPRPESSGGHSPNPETSHRVRRG